MKTAMPSDKKSNRQKRVHIYCSELSLRVAERVAKKRGFAYRDSINFSGYVRRLIAEDLSEAAARRES